MSATDDKDGGLRAAIPFREVWCVDFEYRTPSGEPPVPICMVAKEVFSGRVIQLWRDELLNRRSLPFDHGAETLVLSYFAPAEVACMLELDWKLPENIVDLFAEHRVETNGLHLPLGNGLLGALAIRGLYHHTSATEKKGTVDLILGRSDYTAADQTKIIAYCNDDVDGAVTLLRSMASKLDWPRALLRGRYCKAVARIERAGIPIDNVMYRLFIHERERITRRLIELVDRHYGVYEDQTFKIDRFSRLLREWGIPWPRTVTGRLDLSADTFKEQAQYHTVLAPLAELRQTISALRGSDLQVGSDRRARAMLSPFASLTGRNQPSTKRFAFGPSKWLRGIIMPPPGYGSAYVDYVAQENAIGGALSGDERMIEGYRSGDPHLAFAVVAGLAPADATKESHKIERDQCKEVALGVNYGIGVAKMAAKLGVAPAKARELIARHKSTYRAFWDWSARTVDDAVLTGSMMTPFGWKRRITAKDRATSIMNWPMQANGAEMMRIAAIAATEAGIEVCAPVHDAFLITAPLGRLDEYVAHMRELMSKASEVVTGGLVVRTDAKIIRSPDRYMDDRGIDMWNTVVDLLHVPEARYIKTV